MPLTVSGPGPEITDPEIRATVDSFLAAHAKCRDGECWTAVLQEFGITAEELRAAREAAGSP